MADNEIRVVITGVASDLRRALDGAKGDLGGLRAAIKEVPNQIKVDVQAQTAVAQERLRALRDMAKDVPNRINIEASADTGVAEAKLRLLERQARQTEESIARAQLGGLISSSASGGGGRNGLTAGTSKFWGGLPGQGGGAGVGIALAGAPFAAGAVGSLTALTGSLGAATLGAGALSASLVAVGSVGLGSMLAAIVPAKTAIESVSKAIENLDKAQGTYGKDSKQAATAQKELNFAINDAGPGAAATAKQLDALGERWKELSQPAQHALYDIMGSGLKMVGQLMPTVAGIAKTSFAAIDRALEPVFKELASPAFKKVLTDLGDAFAKLAGPLIAGVANVIEGLLNVAVAAAPYLIQAAQAFERWTKSFAESLSPGQHLTDLIKGLVGQLRSWWDLATALGRLMVTIFSAGAVQGQGLVNNLTQIVNRWNAWLNTSAGQQRLKQFFSDSIGLLKGVASTLAPIVKLISTMAVGLIPTMTTLLAPLASILATVAKWIEGLSKDLPPVLNALPGLAVAAGVLASWQALKTVVSGTSAAMVGKVPGSIGAAPAVAAGGAGMVGIGTRLLGGLGIAAVGSLISTEIGNAVKGGVGRAIKDVGTGASIGGGLGSVFGPWGAAAGAALGSGIGLAVDLFVKHGPSDGEKWAKGFVSSLPGHVSKAVSDGLKKAADTSIPTVNTSQARTRPASLIGENSVVQQAAAVAAARAAVTQAERAAAGIVPAAGQQAETKSIAAAKADLKQALESYNTVYNTWFNQMYPMVSAMGKKAGNAFVDSVQKVRFPTELLLTRDITTALNDVPKNVRAAGPVAVAAWQDNAAKQMLSYASSLQQNGKLPKRSVDNMIAALEQQFPGLTAYLDKSGLDSARAIATHMKLDQALTNLKGAVGTMRSQWGDMAISANLTNANIFKNTAVAMSDLRLLMKSKNKTIREEAKVEYDKLLSETNHTFQAMTDNMAAKATKMTELVQAGSANAYQIGAYNWGLFAKSVANAMASGVISTKDGGKLIGEALNKVLQTFGEKPLGLTTISNASAAQLQAVASGQVSSGALASPHAGGGYIGSAGEKGRDQVPIVVGRGEAILNHSQQRVVNAALAAQGVGGLPELFSKVNRPHYMAAGGFAGGWRNVTASAEDDIGKQGAYGIISPFGYSELSNPPSSLNFSALGNLPPFTRMRIRAGGREVVAAKQDVGAGSSFNPQMGLYPGTVAQLGLSGGEFHVSIERADGQPLTVGGAGSNVFGASVPTLKAPVVKGVGTVARITRAALGKMTAAANSYLQAHAPQPSTGGGGGGGGGLFGGPTAPGLATFEGVTMAKWIADELAWGTQHGWHGQPTSGYRPGFDPHTATGRSEHALINYPGGAVDFGGFTDPAAYATKLALVTLAQRLNYPGPRLMMPIGFHDDGHLSGTGHARGGFVHDQLTSHQQLAQPARTPLQTLAGYGTKLGNLEADIGSSLAQYSSLSGRFGVTEQAAQYLNADGSTNPAGVAAQIADTQTLLAYARRILSDYQQELPLVSEALQRFLGAKGTTQHTITSDQAKIELNKARIARNKVREASIRTALLDLQKPTGDQAGALQNAIKAAKVKYDKPIEAAKTALARYHGKDPNTRHRLQDALSGARSTEFGVLHPLEQALLAAHSQNATRKQHVRAESFRLRQQLAALNTDDKRLAAGDQGLAATVAGLKGVLTGAGGKQGENQIISNLETVAGKLGSVNWGKDGKFLGISTRNQGAAFDEQTTIDQLQNTLATLGRPAAPAGGGGPDLAALNALLVQQAQASAAQTALISSQFQTFSSFMPLLQGRLLGSFATGVDRVPRTGPYLLHRDEMVIPDPSGPQYNRAATVHTATGPIEIRLTFAANEPPIVKLIEATLNQKGLQIISDHSGQRARLLNGVRRA